MDLYERILTKEEINKRFITAVTAIMINKLISSKTGLAESIGVKPAKFSEILNGRMNVGIDMVARMCDFYGVSPDWLLLSRGNNVFRQTAKPKIWIDDEDLNMECTEREISDNKITEETTEKVQSASSDIVTLRLMEKIDEKDKKLDEKDVKIDQLQSELRSMGEELVLIKAKLSQYESQEHSDIAGSPKIAKNVDIKPHSSTSAPSASSASYQQKKQ